MSLIRVFPLCSPSACFSHRKSGIDEGCLSRVSMQPNLQSRDASPANAVFERLPACAAPSCASLIVHQSSSSVALAFACLKISFVSTRLVAPSAAIATQALASSIVHSAHGSRSISPLTATASHTRASHEARIHIHIATKRFQQQCLRVNQLLGFGAIVL